MGAGVTVWQIYRSRLRHERGCCLALRIVPKARVFDTTDTPGTPVFYYFLRNIDVDVHKSGWVREGVPPDWGRGTSPRCAAGASYSRSRGTSRMRNATGTESAAVIANR
jgi:hypothetical protein